MPCKGCEGYKCPICVNPDKGARVFFSAVWVILGIIGAVAWWLF